MIEELSQVVLLVDSLEHQLRVGDVGIVVDVHPGTPASGNVAGYSVEFVTMSGDTMAVLELDETQIRPVRSTDIAHVRELASAS
ncbi:MAG TPA: DUF4926 domain-containing protein [Ktedonobacterales bacterium]|jgi:hypothetical protein|nr:DUF4926 domain-containing protein [Ktedonobacterales bacterium]